MKKKIYLGVLLGVIVLSGFVSLLCFAKIESKPVVVPGVNDIEVRMAEVESMVKELPIRETQLKIKTYTGTIDEVLEQRVIDVNEVYQHAKQTNEKAVQLCNDMGLKVSDREAIQKILDKKEHKLEERKDNSEIIKFVHEIINDPNIQPEPNDPNYTYELEINQAFLLAVMEICEPR